MIAWLLGCSVTEPPAKPVAVRTGWVSSAGQGERTLADGRTFTTKELGERPRVSDCLSIGTVELGDVRRQVAAGIPAPDTDLAFSPDGRWLAIGTYLGEVVVADGWTGEVRVRRTLAESAVKRVAWSPDGKTLYAAEQSVDGAVRALDPHTLEDRHTFLLADALERSAPPAPDDLYGLYTLPGPYGLEVLADGDLIVVGAHGWNTPEGRRNRSQAWRLGPDLAVKQRWPAEPADATFLAATVGDERVAIAVSRSAAGEPPEGIGVGGVAVLDDELALERTVVPDPLKPWFDRAFVWQAIGLSGERLTLGLGDGRVVGSRTRNLGTPVLAGEVPIAATIGTLVDSGTAVYTLTSGTSIPYGSGRPEAQPPEPHPAENTVFALDPETLETRWSWRGDEALHGLTLGDRWLVVGVGPKQPAETSRHGLLVFDLSRSGTGEQRIAASCRTGQPVFWKVAVAPDGRIAVASFPAKIGERIQGSYRAQIFL